MLLRRLHGISLAWLGFSQRVLSFDAASVSARLSSGSSVPHLCHLRFKLFLSNDAAQHFASSGSKHSD